MAEPIFREDTMRWHDPDTNKMVKGPKANGKSNGGLGALTPIKSSTPTATFGGIGGGAATATLDGSAGIITVLEDISDGITELTEQVRKSISNLNKHLAHRFTKLMETTQKQVVGPAGPSRDDLIDDADVDSQGNIGEETDSQGNDGVAGGFPKFKIPKPGPKLGLALLLGGLAALMAFGDKMVPYIAPVLKFIKEKALPFAIDAAKKAFEGIKTVFMYLYDNVWPFIKDNIIMNAVDYVKDTFDAMVQLFDDLKEKFGILFSEDATWWEKIQAFIGIFTDIGQFFIDQFDRFTEFVANIFGVSFAPYDGLLSFIKGKLSEGFKVVVDWFSETGEFLLEGAKGIWGWTTDKISTMWTGISEWFSETGEFLLEGATGIWGWLKDKFAAPIEFLKDLFSWPESPDGLFSFSFLGATVSKFLDIILLPYNLAINWLMGIFGFSNTDADGNVEPFSIGDFVVGLVGDMWEWIKGKFNFGGDDGAMFNLPNIGDAFMNMIGKMLPKVDSWIGRALYKIPGTGTLKKAAEMFAAGGSIEGGVMTMPDTAEQTFSNKSALEQIKRNQANMDIYDDYDSDKMLRDGHSVESKLFELEMKNQELLSQLTGAELKKLAEWEAAQGFAQGGGIAVTSTDASTQIANENKTVQSGELAVEGKDEAVKTIMDRYSN